MRVKISHSIDFYRYRVRHNACSIFFWFESDEILYQNYAPRVFLFDVRPFCCLMLSDDFLIFQSNWIKSNFISFYFTLVRTYLFYCRECILILYVYNKHIWIQYVWLWKLNRKKNKNRSMRKINGQHHILIGLKWHGQLKYINCLHSIRRTYYSIYVFLF